ncbi:MAG: putative DNA-binding domain-containing protein [Gammaproteobacteria bacterium]|nr:putative DNA-binding domain-containing protein [Gammaproteobacteria bacterium]MDH4314528.1 putative DNA-binding domain-containing protein [Gammaproteobacteria bacterium]MDH5214588.1 putative DNA-binding domain-containing protein [Gammaproteobacteria bacterium]MDH5500103.1 putative DNA-binding domain-containing protein [Gammaproteobacteria bacterium]
MAKRPEFQQKQFAFAAHIRAPDSNAAPEGVEDRRMAIYRELFFNNLHKLISSTFPVLRKLHSKERWRALIREFMVRHEAQTPYFLEIPKEFLKFLEQEHVGDEDFPFLLELAHYEWAELALSIAEDEDDMSSIDPRGDLLDGVPVKSVLAWSLAYRYPVHRISEQFKPLQPGDHPTFLAVWRKPDDELGFMELNPLTARLVEIVDTNDDHRCGRELLLELARELKFGDAGRFLVHGAAALGELRDAGILLGTRIAPARVTESF